MKIVTDLHALTQAATAATQAVRDNKDAPVLTCLKIATDGDRITVLGYDRETWVRMTVVGVTVEEPGACLVPARDFLSWLRASPPGKVTVEATPSQIRLERGGRAFLPAFPVGEYPEPDIGPRLKEIYVTRPDLYPDKIPDREPQHLCDVTLPCAAVLAAFARVLFCCEKKEASRFTTRGVLVEVGDCLLTLCATDNRHVAVTTLETARPSNDGRVHAAIVPHDAAFKIAAVVGAESEVTISVSDHSVVFRGDRSELGTRLLEGRFPPFRRYQELANTSDADRIEVPTPGLLAAVQQATAVTPEGAQQGRLEMVFGGDLTLYHPGKTYENPETGEVESGSTARVSLPSPVPDLAVVVYAPNLVDFLRVAVAQGSKSVSAYPANRPGGPWLLRALPSWDYYPPLMVEPKKQEDVK